MKGPQCPDMIQQTNAFPLGRSEAPYGTMAASMASPPLRHQVAKLLGTPALSAKDAHKVTEYQRQLQKKKQYSSSARASVWIMTTFYWPCQYHGSSRSPHVDRIPQDAAMQRQFHTFGFAASRNLWWLCVVQLSCSCHCRLWSHGDVARGTGAQTTAGPGAANFQPFTSGSEHLWCRCPNSWTLVERSSGTTETRSSSRTSETQQSSSSSSVGGVEQTAGRSLAYSATNGDAPRRV